MTRLSTLLLKWRALPAEHRGIVLEALARAETIDRVSAQNNAPGGEPWKVTADALQLAQQLLRALE